jgi:hypothetical protein
MRHTTIAALCLLATLTLPACHHKQNAAEARNDASTTVATPNQPLTAEQLGELGAKIQKEPARGEEILAEHHLTRDAFEKAIREVTENADASKRYAAAYRKASA